MAERVIHLTQTRRERSEPMRRSLEMAADGCLNLNIKGYALIVVDTNDCVHMHWDGGGRNLSLVGGLETAKAKLLAEDD